METLKEGLINTFEKYLRDGIKDGIDYRLAHLTDQYLEDLIDKIRKFLNDKKSEKLPQTILSYIEYCKECIKKRYIKLLCEKSSGRKIYDDNAERIREDDRKNIQNFWIPAIVHGQRIQILLKSLVTILPRLAKTLLIIFSTRKV